MKAPIFAALVLVGCGGSDFRTNLFGAGPGELDTGDASVQVEPVDAHGEDFDTGDVVHQDASAGGTGGTTSTIVSAGGLRASGGGASSSGGSPVTGGSPATGGSSSSGGSPATGGSSSSGGSPAMGGSSSSGGSPAVCPPNPRTDCTNYCGDVTSRCCVAAHCGCLTDTPQGRVCL